MKNLLLPASILLFIFSCNKKNQLCLEFLDEYLVKDSTYFNETLIGGMSGIDFDGDTYYMVVDDSEKPSFIKAKIDIKNNQIKSVNIDEVVEIGDTLTTFFKNHYLDLESIFVDNNSKEINFVSEGSIAYKKSPSVFTTDSLGNFICNYKIPDYFVPREIINLKHNKAFEGSSKSVDGKGFWVAMESPLISDGVQPTYKKSLSPVRITYFDKKTKKATKQFSYELNSIERPRKGKVNLKGLTAILEYEENKFFIVERTYQSNYGFYGNQVKIYDVTLNKNTTNTLNILSLNKNRFISAEKKLIFDFNSVKSELTKGIVDNIEGITFGPKLPNGNQSLILVSDDNFQKYGKQLNQFLLLEIIKK